MLGSPMSDEVQWQSLFLWIFFDSSTTTITFPNNIEIDDLELFQKDGGL